MTHSASHQRGENNHSELTATGGDNPTLQRQNKPHQQNALQDNRQQSEVARQLQVQTPAAFASAQALQRNNTGLPDTLKSGMERISGMGLDDVRVHYNSPQPAAVQAHAYAQGNDIHLAAGQERHLPHELGHVVQQAQGRVNPTTSIAGVAVNDNPRLENEATQMGHSALQRSVIQRALITDKDIKPKSGSNYEWKKHRTNYSDDGDEKIAEGLGAKIKKSTKTLKTKITWAAVDNKSKEGTSMTAAPLGPDHKLGSNPQSGGGKIWNMRRKQLQDYTGESYVAGHLLSAKLGGPGNLANNLTAIPQSANIKHSDRIEGPIKKAVNEEGKWVSYQLDVEYTGKGRNRHASQLTATVSQIDSEGNVIEPSNRDLIKIDPPKKKADSDSGSDSDSDSSSSSSSNKDKKSLIKAFKFDLKKGAQTDIKQEELVMTSQDDLRLLHRMRAPLLAEIARLKAEVASLKASQTKAEAKTGNGIGGRTRVKTRSSSSAD